MSVCLHPKLKCDGHPQCDQAEDEDVDQCYYAYLEKGIITISATYQCKSTLSGNEHERLPFSVILGLPRVF